MPIITRGAKYLFATVCVPRVKTVYVDGEIKRAHVMRARLSIYSSDLSGSFHKLYFTISFYKDVSKIPVDYVGTTSRPVFILFFSFILCTRFPRVSYAAIICSLRAT